ncbi:hypothetical protein OEV98_04360 [Caldibacillus lycopersici]|uniref:Uncharacterized protein n=1 Tax=Perspicuibacillus lycopersici TaxID=1325689 RepID=A0AAE3IVE8_9BACI|nr:hypothetical protein [Perspicuibacillus lycopersici]MCU9612780.1 hypothetical protein [Perspicuibacillus lycopersici]
MLIKKAIASLFIFFLLLLGAWLLNNNHEEEPTINLEQMNNGEASYYTIPLSTTPEEVHAETISKDKTTFKPREYIKFHKRLAEE